MPLFFILITISIDRIYGDGFCDSEQKTTSIYNIGNTVIISQGDTLWKYDVMNNTMAEEGTSVNDIFRDGCGNIYYCILIDMLLNCIFRCLQTS